MISQVKIICSYTRWNSQSFRKQYHVWVRICLKPQALLRIEQMKCEAEIMIFDSLLSWHAQGPIHAVKDSRMWEALSPSKVLDDDDVMFPLVSFSTSCMNYFNHSFHHGFSQCYVIIWNAVVINLPFSSVKIMMMMKSTHLLPPQPSLVHKKMNDKMSTNRRHVFSWMGWCPSRCL